MKGKHELKDASNLFFLIGGLFLCACVISLDFLLGGVINCLFGIIFRGWLN